MKLVIIESPYAGNVGMNLAYAREAILDSLNQGEAPFASHLLYPQVLDDAILEQRTIGIKAGLAWGKLADLTAVYIDLGISKGMYQGIEAAEKAGRKVVYRRIRIFREEYAYKPPKPENTG